MARDQKRSSHHLPPCREAATSARKPKPPLAARQVVGSWVSRIGLMIVSLVVVVVILELGVRLMLPQDLIKPMVTQLDSELIYMLTPNYAAHLKGTSVRWFHLTTNSLGLREREIPFQKPPGVFRILLLGDSVSMAEGVELEETYLKQLESLVRGQGWRTLETINAAVRGYGNDQELVLFRRLGKRFEPDLVILAFYTGNDLEDNWEGQLFRLEGGTLLQQPATPQSSRKYRFYTIQSAAQHVPGYSFMMAHSQLANFMRVAFAKILQDTVTTDPKYPDDVIIADRPEFHLTAAIIRAWSREVQTMGARPFLLIIPPVETVDAVKNGRGVDRARLDLAVEQLGVVEKIPTMNLISPMARHHDEGERLWLSDGHLSPAGHAWVAKRLFEALRADHLLSEPLGGKGS